MLFAPNGSPELMLMLLADARLPTGGHTQSGGLEPALLAGMSIDDVPGYLEIRLTTVTAVDAGAAVLARHAVIATDGVGDLAERLTDIDIAWRARTISPALRTNADTLGRGYARLLTRLWPEHPGVRALGASRTACRAVAMGVAAAAAGLSAAQLARWIGYDDVQSVAAAALKLRPMDPIEATRWVLSAAPAVERMVGALSSINSTDELPATGAPLIEQWAELHAVASQRLFRA